MPDIILSDDLWGNETMQFSFFRIPNQLVSHPLFQRLPEEHKEKIKYERLQREYPAVRYD